MSWLRERWNRWLSRERKGSTISSVASMFKLKLHGLLLTFERGTWRFWLITGLWEIVLRSWSTIQEGFLCWNTLKSETLQSRKARGFRFLSFGKLCILDASEGSIWHSVMFLTKFTMEKEFVLRSGSTQMRTSKAIRKSLKNPKSCLISMLMVFQMGELTSGPKYLKQEPSSLRSTFKQRKSVKSCRKMRYKTWCHSFPRSC
jgi:hypothetical protein